MGFVFKARQPKIERLVALKILPQSLAADPAFAERFTREARMLARLNHPNIVTIHDFGQANGFFYLLMEFVDGVNLRQAMKVGRFTPAQALAIVPKICEALQFAHNEGILHRDIKPENILLDSKGRVKIADFGIAKLVRADMQALTPALSHPMGEGGAPAPGEGATQEVHLTETGKALGTPQYMAPEQIEHPQDVDQRADIYSLGVVFYEMLTGELPLGRFAPPSEKSAVDPRVDEVVLRALEKERERRTQTAGEVRTQVETISAASQQPPNKATDAAAKAAPSPVSPCSAPRIRTWSPLAVSSALLVLLVVFGGLCLDSFRSFRASYFLAPYFRLPAGLGLLVAPALGALALWDFGAGGHRRGLVLALFGTFSNELAMLNWSIILPCIYLFFPSISPEPLTKSYSLYSPEIVVWMLLQSALVVGELWMLARVWSRFAAANGLSRESLCTSRSFPDELLSQKRVAGWWKVSAWVLIIAGASELLVLIAYLTNYCPPSWAVIHSIGLSSNRGFANVFAGLALLTLNPRWRTAAIVTMWFAAVSLAFRLAHVADDPETAAITISGLFRRFCDQPIEHVLGEIAGLGLIVWPYWMLTRPRGEATFGLATKR